MNISRGIVIAFLIVIQIFVCCNVQSVATEKSDSTANNAGNQAETISGNKALITDIATSTATKYHYPKLKQMEMLKLLPSVIMQMDNVGLQTISYRGLSQKYIQIMCDNVPVGLQSKYYEGLDNINMAGNIAMESYNSSRLSEYTNAFGAINLFSVEQDRNNSIDLNMEYEENSINSALNYSGVSGDLYWNVAALYKYRDKYKAPEQGCYYNDGSSYKEIASSIFEHSSYDRKMGYFALGMHISKKSNICGSVNYSQHEYDELDLSESAYQSSDKLKAIQANLSYYNAESDYWTFKGNLYYRSVENIMNMGSLSGYSVTQTEDMTGGRLMVGFKNGFLEETKLFAGYGHNNYTWKDGLFEFISESNYDIISLRLRQPAKFNMFTIALEGGMEINSYSSDSRNNVTTLYDLTGRVDYEASENFVLYASVSRVNRYLRIYEIEEVAFRSHMGDDEIFKPESITSFEIGSQHQVFDNFWMFVTYYNSEIDNAARYSRWYEPSQGLSYEMYRYSYGTSGCEVNFYYNDENTYFNAKSMLMHSDRYIVYTELDLVDPAPEFYVYALISRYLGYNFTLRADFEMMGDRKVRGDVPYYLVSDMLNSYMVFGGRISYKILDDLSLYFHVSNITDECYRQQYYFPSPGRQFYLGINFGYGFGK